MASGEAIISLENVYKILVLILVVELLTFLDQVSTKMRFRNSLDMLLA